MVYLTSTLKKSATKRTKNADPNSGRCLIENCSSTGAIRVARVYDRDFHPNDIDSIEWVWKMVRGTLNLDSRRNTFCLGESLYEMYKNKNWALLPTEEDVLRFIRPHGRMPCTRENFPDVQGGIFKYRFLPLSNMDDVYITRQSSEERGSRVEIHNFPFEDFPVIASQVDPRYVILHLGDILFGDFEESVRLALLEKYPYLHHVGSLYTRWTAPIPMFAFKDRTFIPGPSHSNDLTSPVQSHLEDDDTCTPSRRNTPLPPKPMPWFSSSSETSLNDECDDHGYWDGNSTNNSDDMETAVSSGVTGGLSALSTSKSVVDRIFDWAKELSSSIHNIATEPDGCLQIRLLRLGRRPKLQANKQKRQTESTYLKNSTIKNVKNMDPSLGRCLIENCSSTGAIRLVRVYNRDFHPNNVDSMEWEWNMVRGTLNLDTRRNVFCLGESMYELYKNKKWALLPTEEDVMNFFSDAEGDTMCMREDFPPVQAGPFMYKFLPLGNMDDIYITRQSRATEDGSNRVDVYEYPFDDFPVITSHVDPRYVILHLGETLFGGVEDEVRMALFETYPYLSELWSLSTSWTAPIPMFAFRDRTYIPRPPNSNNLATPVQSNSEDDEASTPSRRNTPLLPKPMPWFSSSSETSLNDECDDHGYWDGDSTNSSDGMESAVSSSVTGGLSASSTSQWVVDRVFGWSKECCSPTPPPEVKPPLRRSTRIRKKPKHFLS
ncbi:hypothetical protein CVT24_012831 [Panaeolus cyanescens]|uniref:HNH nuclease domain-containing protein n=1 Tax=Panaeolus cyanescens TaxID=181874 RepID=A0A409W6M3_9AGAR|nr:hypothetical protein CVT24_012831 [Panaeolus cyanescens]